MAQTKKLGELLIEAGLITSLEVDHALQAQQIFGGRLGTNLIEMGVLDDDTLATFLSQQLSVPRVSIEEMENVPEDVLELIPAKAAQRLYLLPIAKLEDRLILVMMDPTDQRILSRLEQNISLQIETRIATEIEIRYFLEKYYGIQRDMRHITLMNQVLKARNASTPVEKNKDPISIFLDEHFPIANAIQLFFEHVKSLEKVPVQVKEKDLTQYSLTPEISYLHSRADGLSSLGDILISSVFPRVSTMRAMIYLMDLELIQFEAPYTQP